MSVIKRMAMNVGVTVLRMASTVGIGLYTVRLLNDSLGTIDFGLYGLLGGSAALLTVLQASLVQMAQRHLAYRIGEGDEEGLREVFATTTTIFLAAAALLITIGWLVTPYLLTVFEYPTERRSAVEFTWLVFVLSFGLIIIRAPFTALFVARQAMTLEALCALCGSIQLMISAMVLSSWDGDRLKFLACLILLLRFCEFVLYAALAVWKFREARIRFSSVRRDYFAPLLSFGGWGLMDALAIKLRNLGGNLAINLFFGPAVNAAYTNANSLQNWEITLARTIQRASNPVIIQQYAAGNTEFVCKLVLSVCRVSVLALSVLALPALLEIDYLLSVWLVEVPQYTSGFALTMILAVLIEQMSIGYVSAMYAVGEVRVFHTATLVAVAVPFTASILLFLAGYGSPPLLTFAILIGVVALTAFRAWYTGKSLSLPFSVWLREVAFRSGIAIGASAVAGVLCSRLVPTDGALRFVCSTLGVWVALAPLGWFIGLTSLERRWLTTRIHGYLQRRAGRSEA